MNVITEGITVTSPIFENVSDIPDQNNCSFDRHSDHVITGGRLLKKRAKKDYGGLADGTWVNCLPICSQVKEGDVIPLTELHKHHGEVPFGGVCDSCFQNEENAGIISCLEFQ